jgi:uncharacterized Zn-finger protein
MFTTDCPWCNTTVRVDGFDQVGTPSRVESPRNENVACPDCGQVYSVESRRTA